jgi:hypothetical protein
VLTLGAYVSLESLNPNLFNKKQTDYSNFYERQAENHDLFRYKPWNFACGDHMGHLRSPVSADSLYPKNICINSASTCPVTSYISHLTKESFRNENS